ncbi:MAG: Threonine aldolase [Bradyrhizobium sp.]|nr:Threonine aldolase [Bradyrhizobium sp.]
MSANAPIDLRSDTVTRPTARMLAAMHDAPLGDDSLEGDPTVRRLETQAAALLGKESALFVTSGTMGNLVAALTHGEGGGCALVDSGAHIAVSEGGGLTQLARLKAIAIPSRGAEMLLDGLDAEIASQKRAAERVAMLVVESSHNHSGGRVPSLEYMAAIHARAHAAGTFIHLDGARLFNGALALGVEPRLLADFSDSVSICLSKGLSAPLGSLLLGTRGFIDRARGFRRMVGGGLRQAGCVAAAGVVGLDEMIPRLAEDHHRAEMLWRAIRSKAPALVEPEAPQTNIVLLLPEDATRALSGAEWEAELAQHGVLVRVRTSGLIRMVVHRHISDDDIARTASVVLQRLTT